MQQIRRIKVGYTTRSGKLTMEVRDACGELIREMKDMCQGVHIMPIGWEKRVPAVLDAAGL